MIVTLRRPRRFVLAAASVVVVAVVATGACTGSGQEPPANLELGPLASAGAALSSGRGCAGCHSTNGDSGSGPTWKALWGSTVSLGDGSEVTADAEYVRTAVVDPRSEVVDGYANIMPVYKDLSEQDVESLVAYICALGASSDAETCEELAR